MRLINVTTRQLEEFFGRDVPPYATLSHTWGADEVNLQQWLSSPSSPPTGAGADKIAATCQRAAQDGLGYAWVDTVCIDQRSSAELSEAINSMHAWYARSAVCYVHLCDLAPDASLSDDLQACRWFTRGWTLQELLAPRRRVVFFDASWAARAERNDDEMLPLLASITGIREEVLRGETPLSALPTAEKMAWAARRKTTRAEDVAYCLLGLFGIAMPLLYGEGGTRAFRRLQEAILQKTTDRSIFAWQLPAPPAVAAADDNDNTKKNKSRGRRKEYKYSGFLAPSPAAFSTCHISTPTAFGHAEEFAVTNCGIKTSARVYAHLADGAPSRIYLLPVQWDGRTVSLGVRMRKCGADRYVREDPYGLVNVDAARDAIVPTAEAQKYLLTDLPPETTSSTNYDGDSAGDGWPLLSRAQVVALRGRVLHLSWYGPVTLNDFWPAARGDAQHEAFFTGHGHRDDDALILSGMVWANDGPMAASNNGVRWRGPCFRIVCFLAGWSGSSTTPPQVSLVPFRGDGGTADDERAVSEEFVRAVKHADYGSAQLRGHLRATGVPRRREARFVAGEGRLVRVWYELTWAAAGVGCEGGCECAEEGCWSLCIMAATATRTAEEKGDVNWGVEGGGGGRRGVG